MSGKKYDKNDTFLCNELRKRRKDGWSYEKLDSKYQSTCLTTIISCIVGACECNSTKEREEHIDARDDEPWKEKYVIETLYIDMELRFTDMSKVMDCHSETAKKYVVDIFDVSTIDSSKRTSSPRVNNLLRLGAKTNGDIDIK